MDLIIILLLLLLLFKVNDTHVDDLRRVFAETRRILHWFSRSRRQIFLEQFSLRVGYVALVLLRASLPVTIRLEHVPVLHNNKTR